ncbi:hypothetical protein K3495_g9392 [Podosphaera aphanis]|nr:hypothetical protein K3495_g9392 [Podosphaera aphanis]
MSYNKDRLYVALYSQGIEFEGDEEEERESDYVWGLILGPKYESMNSTVMKFIAISQQTEDNCWKWEIEEREQTLREPSDFLVRIRIAKVEDKVRLLSIIRKTPTRVDSTSHNNVFWVQDTLHNLKANRQALGTSVLDWKIISEAALKFCKARKKVREAEGISTVNVERFTYNLLKHGTYKILPNQVPGFVPSMASGSGAGRGSGAHWASAYGYGPPPAPPGSF